MKKLICCILLLSVLFLSGCHAESTTENMSSQPAESQQETSGTESTAVPVTDDASALKNESEASTDAAEKGQINSEPVTGSKRIDFTPLPQSPELPTGCEVTSLTMVLNYYGLLIDKCDIADNYLEKGDVGTVSFYEAFEGDPRDENSFGCYAPVIVKTAEKVIAEKHAGLTVKEVTGQELESLFSYIDADIPVIIWGTLDCQQGHYSMTWEVNGETLRWFTPEHCMVLVGYDDTSVWVADPVHGDIRSYNKDIFKLCYNSLYKQAVVISQ